MSFRGNKGGLPHGLLLNVLAVVVAFIGTSELYSMTVDWAMTHTLHHYGQDWLFAIPACWFCICACLVFGIGRIVAAIALSFIMTRIANWF